MQHGGEGKVSGDRDFAGEQDLAENNVTRQLVEKISPPVGFIVINWAMVETALVFQIEAVAHLAIAKGLEARRQGAFSDRVRTMQRLLNQLPELERYKVPALALLEEVKNFQTLRDTLVNGSLQAIEPQAKGLVFNRLKPTRDKDGHDISQELVTFDSLQRAVFVLAEMRQKMMSLANSLMRKFGQD